jgi:hypothetical protein
MTILKKKCCCVPGEPQDCFYIATRCECSPAGPGVAVSCANVQLIISASIDLISVPGIYAFKFKPVGAEELICYEIDLGQTPVPTTDLQHADPFFFIVNCDSCCDVEIAYWAKYAVCPCSENSPPFVWIYGGLDGWTGLNQPPPFIYATPKPGFNWEPGCYQFVELWYADPPLPAPIASCDPCCQEGCPPSDWCEQSCPDAMVVTVPAHKYPFPPFIIELTQAANIVIQRVNGCVWEGCLDVPTIPGAVYLNGEFVEPIRAGLKANVFCDSVGGAFVWRCGIGVDWYGIEGPPHPCPLTIDFGFGYMKPATPFSCPPGSYVGGDGVGPGSITIA